MKVPAHLNYTQAFAGPFRPTPPGTVVQVTPLLGLGGPFPGNAGPFVTPPRGYAGFGADAAAKPATPVVAAKPPVPAEPSGTTPVPVPGPMPRVPVAAEPSDALRTINKVAGYAGYMAGAYHGYKRNESVGWAFGWALFGGLIWPLAIPVMFAQGFGKPIAKPATANRKAKRNARQGHLPSHLNEAYAWTMAGGELNELKRLRGRALTSYVRESAENAAEHGESGVTKQDLRELAEWLRRQ